MKYMIMICGCLLTCSLGSIDAVAQSLQPALVKPQPIKKESTLTNPSPVSKAPLTDPGKPVDAGLNATTSEKTMASLPIIKTLPNELQKAPIPKDKPKGSTLLPIEKRTAKEPI